MQTTAPVSQTFFILWESAAGARFVTRYTHDAQGEQKGYSFAGWRSRCISLGKQNGSKYVRLASAAEFVQPKPTFKYRKANKPRRRQNYNNRRTMQVRSRRANR